MVFSAKKVREEVREKEDDVKKWCDALPTTFFIEDSGSKEVMANYAKLMAWAQSSAQYTKTARDQFARADKADAFLVAAAMTGGYEIVTHEAVQPAVKIRIPIPNAATAFNVKCISIYDLLAKYALPTFLINPNGPTP
jgi:hypothetical protein